jgi:hypothetical protein
VFCKDQNAENAWKIVIGFHPSVDFCVWLLEADGLRVSPFDLHDEQDGPLQRVGLDAGTWTELFTNVLRAQRARDGSSIFHIIPPSQHVPAGDRLGKLLDDAWHRHVETLMNYRKRDEQRLSPPALKMRNLWHDLAPYRASIPPPMIVHYVDYSNRIQYLLSPSTVVMGIRDWTPDSSGLRDVIIEAASQLARMRS